MGGSCPHGRSAKVFALTSELFLSTNAIELADDTLAVSRENRLAFVPEDSAALVQVGLRIGLKGVSESLAAVDACAVARDLEGRPVGIGPVVDI